VKLQIATTKCLPRLTDKIETLRRAAKIREAKRPFEQMEECD
jgi:hypothetical protein